MSEVEKQIAEYRHWLFSRAGLSTACLVLFMVFLGFLDYRTAQTNLGTAGATAITAVLGAMINPKSPGAPATGSKFEVPQIIWTLLVLAAIALTVLSGVLILLNAKYVNASAGMLGGIAAIGGLLVNPAAFGAAAGN